MKTFISWSGVRSRYVAETLSNWLEQVLQSLEPWISSDIDKGKRWSEEIATKLKESKIAIICLTKDNLDSKWIHFEAGAISKNSDAYVCTFLFDITAANVEQPLSQFQNTRFDKGDMLKLLKTINGIVKDSGGKGMKEANLVSVFDMFWEQLETKLANVPEANENGYEPREDRELLEESLQILRSIKNNLAPHMYEPINMGNNRVHASSISMVLVWMEKFASVNGCNLSIPDLEGREYEIVEYLKDKSELVEFYGSKEMLANAIKQKIAELPPF